MHRKNKLGQLLPIGPFFLFAKRKNAPGFKKENYEALL